MIDVTEHLGLAQKIAWNIYPKVHKKYEFEDILQVAYVGLTKAGKNFDESKGIKFSSYAFATIKGELIRFISDDKKYNISRGMQHGITILSYEFENENGCLRNKIGANEFEEKLIMRETLNQAISQLSKQEKKIFKLYFIDELTQKQIGEICGIFQNQVARVKKRISKKMKSALTDIYYEKVSV